MQSFCFKIIATLRSLIYFWGALFTAEAANQKILRELGFERGAAGLEARTLPLCSAATEPLLRL